MEIVIKIPEEKYNEAQKRLKRGYTLGSLDMAILSGTVLPKGHGALKDADMIYAKAEFYAPREFDVLLMDVNVLKNAPTIIEADKEAEDEVISTNGR